MTAIHERLHLLLNSKWEVMERLSAQKQNGILIDLAVDISKVSLLHIIHFLLIVLANVQILSTLQS